MDRRTEALLSSIEWLRKAVLELSERATKLEAENVEERIRGQQLARDCESDLRSMQGDLEKANARAAKLEREVEERAHQLLRLRAELEGAREAQALIKAQAAELLRQERDKAEIREHTIRELERRTQERSTHNV